MNSPDFLVREVKDPAIHGIFRSLNEVYPIGARKPNSRYMGEILRVTDLHGVVQLQQEREFRFFSQDDLRRLEFPGNLAVGKPSPYTHNIVAYMERPADDIRVYSLGISSIRGDVQEAYLAAKELQKKIQVDDLLLPIDHLATRVYSQNREVAILEYLSLSSYYYWGSYDIKDQNSSTNVTKSVHYADELVSPAKVFTANNTPYFVNHLEKLPSPTETFVRNYGPRLHHVAVAVKDGEHAGMEWMARRVGVRADSARLLPEARSALCVALQYWPLAAEEEPAGDTQQLAICDDARGIPAYLPEESVSLILTSPPYANLLNRPRKNKSRRGPDRRNRQYKRVEQYSQDKRDLGTLSLERYSEEMGSIFAGLLPLLRPKAHCLVNVPDMWWENERITIHIAVVEALRAVGYELRNTIIWDRTNIVNRIGIFGWPSNYITMGVSFEYLLDFWRPPE